MVEIYKTKLLVEIKIYDDKCKVGKIEYCEFYKLGDKYIISQICNLINYFITKQLKLDNNK